MARTLDPFQPTRQKVFQLEQSAAENPLLREVRPDEHVLWQGRPQSVRAYVFRGPAAPLAATLLFELGFLAIGAALLVFADDVMARLVGIVFVAVSLGRLGYRLLLGAVEAGKTLYVVTDRRILIRSGAFRPTDSVVSLGALPHLILGEERWGLGTIYLDKPPALGDYFDDGGFELPSQSALVGLFAIENASEVYRAIRAARDRGHR